MDPRPAAPPPVNSGGIRTRREAGESQGRPQDGSGRGCFDWHIAPSPASPGVSVEAGQTPVIHLLGLTHVRILTISLVMKAGDPEKPPDPAREAKLAARREKHAS